MADIAEDLFDLREKVRQGEEVPAGDYAKIIDGLRKNRKAKPASKSKKAAKPAGPLASMDNLSELFAKPVKE